MENGAYLYAQSKRMHWILKEFFLNSILKKAIKVLKTELS